MVNIINRFGMQCVPILAFMHFHTKKTKRHEMDACMKCHHHALPHKEDKRASDGMHA